MQNLNQNRVQVEAKLHNYSWAMVSFLDMRAARIQ